MLNAREPSQVVAPMSFLARDGFIADTAVKLDHLQAAVDQLSRDTEETRDELFKVLDNQDREARLRTFDETLRNARELKLDELLRTIRDLRERLDAVEGPRSQYMGLTARSFVALDRRLAAMSLGETRIARLERWLMAAGALAVTSTLATLVQLVLG